MCQPLSMMDLAEGEGLKRSVGGRDLRQDVDAVFVLIDHPLQATNLPFDAMQPREVVMLTIRVSGHLSSPLAVYPPIVFWK
jgi:hypothetical protein